MSTITTKRLLLRPFCENDAEAMYKNWTYDERVARYCRWYPHEGIEVTKKLLDMYIQKTAEGFDYIWGIVLRENNELVGCIDVVNLSEDKEIATIGYLLSYEHWNKGYVTEALSTVIKKLFDDGIKTVKAMHHIENPASGKVMEKCGMKYTHNDIVPGKFGTNETCEVRCYEIHNLNM